MVYAIIGIIVAVALFLIFWDDHDRSYNKAEKGQKKPQQNHYQKEAPKAHFSSVPPKTEPKKEQPKVEKKPSSGPSLKDQILGEIEAAIGDAKKGADEPLKLFGEVMGMARDVVKNAIKEAQDGWNSVQAQPDVVDEQFPEEEELDLQFLDTIDYSNELEENTETFDITGLRYHCTVYDCGKIVGIVKPEPSNVHDSRAQAVIRNDGKLLGYIPRTQLDWYEDFNEQNIPCPFVGQIELDRSSATLIAEIKVIIPSSREYVEREIENGLE